MTILGLRFAFADDSGDPITIMDCKIISLVSDGKALKSFAQKARGRKTGLKLDKVLNYRIADRLDPLLNNKEIHWVLTVDRTTGLFTLNMGDLTISGSGGSEIVVVTDETLPTSYGKRNLVHIRPRTQDLSMQMTLVPDAKVNGEWWLEVPELEHQDGHKGPFQVARIYCD